MDERSPAANLLNPRQRWIAARRLASDDTHRMAACAAGVSTDDLVAYMDADPDFRPLVDDVRAVKALPPEGRRARLADLCWDGAERAILDGRVSTLNQCVRGLDLLLEFPDGGDDDDPDEDWDPLAAYDAGARAFRRTLTPELRAEFDALDDPRPVPNPERAAGPAPDAPPPPAAAVREGAGAAAGEPRPPPPPAAKPVRGGPDGTALATGTVPAPANLRFPCPRPPGPTTDPFPWSAAPSPADLLNVPRPNPNGPTIPTPIRPAREPIPDWHRHPSGWPRPRGP